MDLCFLDIETTGFEPQEDSIIEVSFVRYKDGQLVAEYDQVFATDKSALNDFVIHLTGITQDELDREGKLLLSEIETIRELIGESVIVGHNIDFDIRFLVANGIDISKNQRLDTHELARILLPLEASFALEVLSEKYGFEHAEAHRAMSDVLASKDLFELLCAKIADLPKDYLATIKPVLETKTDWYAKTLFLSATGVATSTFYQKENFYSPSQATVSPLENVSLAELSESYSALVSLGENQASAVQTQGLAQTLVAQGKKVLIVSPKLDYFVDVPKLPTPEVLLDPSGLDRFLSSRERMDNLETTFYLQCQLRSDLGFRGVFFFDLFFKMRGYWNEVKQTDDQSESFNAIVLEKSQEPILALSPEALFRFLDRADLAGRTLIFDEAEFTAEKLLQSPAQSLAFRSWLDHKDESISTAAQFFTSHFCQDVVEPQLGHQITPFGAKILLKERDTFPSFADGLSQFLEGEQLEYWQKWLTDPVEKLTRWVTYFPQSGQLNWYAWHPDDWRDLKDKLGKFPKVFLHRYPFDADESAFWRIFYGLDSTYPIEGINELLSAELEIPDDLISHSSPDFNDFCSAKIATVYGEATPNLAVNFSSLDTMRHCFENLTQTFVDDENFAIFGEKVSGGDGKMWQMVQKHPGKKKILCTQKILKPELSTFETDTLVVQKFPFAAPHPLLQKIEDVMKQSGQSWWDIWVVPQLVANLHRRVGNFHDLKKVVWLDPRENSRWGKTVLRKVFK